MKHCLTILIIQCTSYQLLRVKYKTCLTCINVIIFQENNNIHKFLLFSIVNFEQIIVSFLDLDANWS